MKQRQGPKCVDRVMVEVALEAGRPPLDVFAGYGLYDGVGCFLATSPQAN